MLLNKEWLVKRRYILSLGVCSFVFLFVLTYNVPFFWDDILFLDGVFSHSYRELIIQTLTLGTHNFSHPGLPLTLMLLKMVGFISSIDPLWFRVLHALFFGATIIFLFLFLQVFNISEKRAFIITGVTMFSYPLFLVTFFISQAEIYGFAFQYAGLFLFFHTFFNQSLLSKKRFYLQLAFSALLFFIMLKLFSPLYFLIPALFLFILIYDYKMVKSYVLFFLLLFAVYFPLNLGVIYGEVGLYSLSTANIKHILSLGMTSSFFSFNNLYYKTLPELLTPFGFIILLGLALLGACYTSKTIRTKLFEERPVFDEREKAFILISFLNIVFNLLLLFAVYDPATRYISFIIIPLVSLLVFFLFKVKDIILRRYKLIATVFIICLLIVTMYNIGLLTLFRFTWGSAFIGMDKVSSFIEQLPDDKKILFYYSGTPADEYAPIIIINGTFVKRNNTKIVEKYWQEPVNKTEFAMMSKQEQGTVYIVKRESSFGRTSYPAYNFTEPEFTLVTTIKGENSFIDIFFLRIMHLLHISYNFNMFYVYKWNSNE